ncbi:asparagine synthase-domain-containing protein [Pterulicium gracile]|uniref:Asparagine synthase-domain-containing protein n=1 Tax=Pterulicium gracile TaxID=1884261 RepID=A0A5C3QVS1_9AGAR|nr:asparagine synthase-domain-containing protein [Pterula gracilis]
MSTRLKAANALRGPDAQSSYAFSANDEATVDIELFGAELRLRGKRPVVQPHVLDGDVLCWNGEIFDGVLEVNHEENDGVKLFHELRKRRTKEAISAFFGSIEGPYAFVYYDAQQRTLFYARDPLGRRSLLLHRPTLAAPHLLLSSVAAGPDPLYNFEEVATDAIFCIDIGKLHANLLDCADASIVLVERLHEAELEHPIFTSIAAVNDSLPPDDYPVQETLDHIPDCLEEPVQQLIAILDDSVKRRVESIPPICRSDKDEPAPRLGILFSGGIDCTVLAVLAHRFIPIDEPIDLLNVAFENPRKLRSPEDRDPSVKKPKKNKNKAQAPVPAPPTPYSVPDRVTGIQATDELRRVCPGRKWNFVEVNVPYEESQAAIPTIEALMTPSRTVMDLSLASALYFASRGVGETASDRPGAQIASASESQNELLGGYGRHRTAFNRGGWAALVQELQLEVTRLPSRNLGRDDRVISSHGKETRHPFLSLSVVHFVTQLPVHHKLDPRTGLGLGDKLLLRLAVRKLGLGEASERKKKAMQFGSHSARMHGEKKGDAILE